MKTIPLTKGKVALIDDADFPLVSQFKWYAHEGYNTWYAARRLPKDSNGKRPTQYLHRLLLNPSLSKVDVDHVDGNGLNNCRSNIRVCTRSQNILNSHRGETRSARAAKRFNAAHVFPWTRALLASLCLFLSFGCGKGTVLGTVNTEGNVNASVSINTAQLDYYFLLQCCQASLTTTQTPKPSDDQIQACANAPTPELTTCSQTYTANLLTVVAGMGTTPSL